MNNPIPGSLVTLPSGITGIVEASPYLMPLHTLVRANGESRFFLTAILKAL